MGIRGIIRDIIGLYLGYEIIRGYVTGSFSINNVILICAIVLLAFGVWFMLERIGLIPKFI